MSSTVGVVPRRKNLGFFSLGEGMIFISFDSIADYSHVPNKRTGPNNQGGLEKLPKFNKQGGRNSRTGLKSLYSSGKNKTRLSQRIKLKYTKKHVSLP